MASHASLLGILFHHGPELLDPGRQTEPLKADRNDVPRFVHSPQSGRRQSGQWCDSFLHGVAFLSWNQHPDAYRLKASNAAPPISTFLGAQFPAIWDYGQCKTSNATTSLTAWFDEHNKLHLTGELDYRFCEPYTKGCSDHELRKAAEPEI
jgi:hypothetical protein